MTLVLSNDDVEKVLTMTDCIGVLERAYVELAAGRGVSRVRSDCLTPTERDDALYALKSMDGVVPSLGVAAVRVNSDILTWPKHGNALRRAKVPAAPDNRYTGLVLLFSTETGEPLAFFPDGVIQRMRVGATNGLAIKYLARADATKVGIIGSGWQAGAQLTAVCTVRKIGSIRCYSPNRDNREAFASHMSAALGVEVVPVDQPEDAIRGSDLAMCATSSIDPVFFESWIEEGMHISSIKRPEIELKAIKRATRVVIHTNDANPLHVTTKDLAVPERSNGRGWTAAQGIDFSKLPTLPDLIAGKTEGRRSNDDVTCFINNLGMGIQFAATGSVVYDKAREYGLGHELPTEWFTEDVHP